MNAEMLGNRRKLSRSVLKYYFGICLEKQGPVAKDLCHHKKTHEPRIETGTSQI
jgi:hypothetical protein